MALYPVLHVLLTFLQIVQFAVSFGIFVSYAVNTILLHVTYSWRWMLGLAIIPAFIQLFLGIFYLVESPRWLVSKGRLLEASDILQRLSLRSEKEIKNQIQEIIVAMNQQVVRPFLFVLRLSVLGIFVVAVVAMEIQQNVICWNGSEFISTLDRN